MDKDNIFPLFKEGKRECLPMTRSQAVIQKDNKNNNAFFREQESFVFKKNYKSIFIFRVYTIKKILASLDKSR